MTTMLYRELQRYIEPYYYDKTVSVAVDLFTRRYFTFVRDVRYTTRRKLTAQDITQVCSKAGGR